MSQAIQDIWLDFPRKVICEDSSSVRMLGYSLEKKLLLVEFESGGVYLYDKVSPERFATIVSADSVGKALHSYVKTLGVSSTLTTIKKN